MKYEISSGNGPAECELAVRKLVDYLKKEYGVKLLKKSLGYYPGTFRSATISSDKDSNEFIGTVQWICQSTLRSGHKRKNWFIDFRQVTDDEFIDFDPGKVAYTTMHSGGPGGQNVNKVETGVMAIYTPTGDAVTCTEECSQYANKKKALERLETIIADRNYNISNKNANELRISHTNLTRGNASAAFEGDKFKRIK